MAEKKSSHNKQLDKISQASNHDLGHKDASIKQNGRVSLNALTAQPVPIHRSAKESQGLHQKETRIKQLQEAIMAKKEKNDAVQQAFATRQQNSHFFQQHKTTPQMRQMAAACAHVSTFSKQLKRHAFKSLLQWLGHTKKDKQAATKIVLVWLVGLLSKMFSMLGRSLTK